MSEALVTPTTPSSDTRDNLPATLDPLEVKVCELYAAGMYCEEALEEAGLSWFAWFKRLDRKPALKAEWERAKASRAAYHVRKMEELADSLPASKAQVAMNARQWLAARFSPVDWSEKHSHVDAVTITINTTLGGEVGNDGVSAGNSMAYTLEAHPISGRDDEWNAAPGETGGTPERVPSAGGKRRRGPTASATPKNKNTRKSSTTKKRTTKAKAQ